MDAEDLIPLVPADEHDPRIKDAVAELQALIAAHYPDATFTVSRRDDLDGVYLTPIVDIEDLDEVADVFMARLVDMQVDEGLPVYVVPDWPLHRVREHPRRTAAQRVEERLALLSLGS